MGLRNKKFYLYLAAIAITSQWLAQLADINNVNPVLVSAHSPDYFSKGYTKWQMNGHGTLENKLFSDEMTHYSGDGTTHTIKPLMFFYNDDSPPWVVKSETGILSSDGKDLLLNGIVTVDRAKAEKVRELKINTSNLRVKPETSYAETDAWAELISPPNRTTGTGMKLTFSKPVHLELLANVKGKYE